MNGTFLKVPFHAFVTTGFGLEQPGKWQQYMVLSRNLPRGETLMPVPLPGRPYCEFCGWSRLRGMILLKKVFICSL